MIIIALVGISGKTNDNMHMLEYVVDANECDQQPYGERDKATVPESKFGEQILQSPTRTNQIGNVGI